VVPCAELPGFRVLRAGPALELLVACRGRYARALADAEFSSTAAPATSPGAVASAAGRCPAVSVEVVGMTKSRTCGTAASAPSTTTAGAALPAALATL
jgi:hypothetical protein